MERSLNALTQWRIEKAKRTVSDANRLYSLQMYQFCLNRCYYAVFYAMQAANSLYRFDSKKHMGVIAFFQHTFLKTGLMDKTLSHIITETYNYRSRADYEDMYQPDQSVAAAQLKNAERFVGAVADYLSYACPLEP